MTTSVNANIIINMPLYFTGITISLTYNLTRAQVVGFDSQPEGLGVAFSATGPGLGLIMYIFTTLEFSTHNLEFYTKYI